MSTVVIVKSVLCASLFELMPSKTCCVRLVSKVFVECNGRNPCCVGARGFVNVKGGFVQGELFDVVYEDICSHSCFGNGSLASSF